MFSLSRFVWGNEVPKTPAAFLVSIITDTEQLLPKCIEKIGGRVRSINAVSDRAVKMYEFIE